VRIFLQLEINKKDMKLLDVNEQPHSEKEIWIDCKGKRSERRKEKMLHPRVKSILLRVCE